MQSPLFDRARAAIRSLSLAINPLLLGTKLRSRWGVGVPPPGEVTDSVKQGTNAITVPDAEVIDVSPASGSEPAYATRLDNELANFEHKQVVHDLPGIYHYWSNKYLLPIIREFGFINPDDFFVKQLAAAMTRDREAWYHFVSIGAGNCDTEVRVAHALREQGYFRFTIECVDINRAMLERGQALAADQGCSKHVISVEADLNTWEAPRPYHAVLANQSLHHVLNLEGLFDAIYRCLATTNGVLVTADMIGRNGHLRWPEALEIVNEYWTTLPVSYKYNHQLRRTEETFVNWDCSQEGFEGIRAQDILPLLLERFHFDLFVPFANVVAPFIDRAFGPNFDPDSDSDRALIDAIHARDTHEMLAGAIKPTQMFAVLSTNPKRRRRYPEGLSPEHCVRIPTPVVEATRSL